MEGEIPEKCDTSSDVGPVRIFASGERPAEESEGERRW